MNIGSLLVNVILIVFALGGLGLLGYLFYVFFIKLRHLLKMQPNKPQQQPSNEDIVKGKFCKKCGIKLAYEDSFCGKCGGKVE